MVTAKEAYKMAEKQLRKGNIIREMAETENYFLFGQAPNKNEQIMDDSAFVVNKKTGETKTVWIHPSSDWWDEWYNSTMIDVRQFE